MNDELSGSPAVFIDKDGTLVHDVPYNVDLERMQLMPGVLEGVQGLHSAGYRLIVVTNQSGVARGYFAEEALDLVEERLRAMLLAAGVPLVGFYYCPHHPDGIVEKYAIACQCRKPAPGLLLRAAQDHNVPLGRSWCIGDILNDIEAGRRAGCRTVLVDNGHETEWVLSRQRLPHHVVANLTEAAQIVMSFSAFVGLGVGG